MLAIWMSYAAMPGNILKSAASTRAAKPVISDNVQVVQRERQIRQKGISSIPRGCSRCRLRLTLWDLRRGLHGLGERRFWLGFHRGSRVFFAPSLQRDADLRGLDRVANRGGLIACGCGGLILGSDLDQAIRRLVAAQAALDVRTLARGELAQAHRLATE